MAVCDAGSVTSRRTQGLQGDRSRRYRTTLTVLQGPGLLNGNGIITGNENPDNLREESEISENEVASEHLNRAIFAL